jgi:hypothetical protein
VISGNGESLFYHADASKVSLAKNKGNNQANEHSIVWTEDDQIGVVNL